MGKETEATCMGNCDAHICNHKAAHNQVWLLPFVSKVLAKLAMAGEWKTKPILLLLGALLLDNSSIHFNKQLYREKE